MNDTIQLTIPAQWVQDLPIDQDQLRQALMLGLDQLRQQQTTNTVKSRVIQALLQSGRVHRLAANLAPSPTPPTERQPPPSLAGPPVSEILIAQRRGE